MTKVRSSPASSSRTYHASGNGLGPSASPAAAASSSSPRNVLSAATAAARLDTAAVDPDEAAPFSMLRYGLGPSSAGGASSSTEPHEPSAASA